MRSSSSTTRPYRRNKIIGQFRGSILSNTPAQSSTANRRKTFLSAEKKEILRRLRLGDIRRLLRARYGPAELPNDDAGRMDLHELLLVISRAPHEAVRKMRNAIQVFAPWMDDSEANALIDAIHRTPLGQRYHTARQLGDAFQLSNEERERLRLWTIQPIDMSDEALIELKKYKKCMRDRQRRQRAGRLSRDKYLDDSLSRRKPWETEGVSRRTWYRRRRLAQVCARQDSIKA